MKNQKKFLFLIFLIVVSLTWLLIFLNKDFFQINQLNIYAAIIFDFIDNNYLRAFLIYIFSYALLVSINFPLGSVLSIIGGFFFGTWVGALAITLGSSTGAMIAFFCIRYLFLNFFNQRIYSKYPKFKNYFDNNSTQLILLIRLVPVLPYAVQNIFLACTGISARKFYFITIIGQTPWSLIYASIGMGMNDFILEDINVFSQILSNPKYLIPLILFDLLIVFSIIFKKQMKKEIN